MAKKIFVFTKDYPLAGKKKGQELSFTKLPHHLKSVMTLKEGQSEDEEELEDEVPTKEWNNADIIAWLADQGVPEAKGTKEELLKEVKKILKK